MQELVNSIIAQLRETTWLEFVAVIFGMLSVILANRNHVALYPTGIISTVIYIYLMLKVKLYAESALNTYYFIMSVYGWYRWHVRHENESAAAISKCNRQDWITTSFIAVGGWIILYTILHRYTDSDVPVWDAVVSSFAWAGMWLLAKHKYENWLLLNVSNLIAIPLQIHKKIPFTAILTLFLFIVAIFGYFRWKKLYRQQLAS